MKQIKKTIIKSRASKKQQKISFKFISVTVILFVSLVMIVVFSSQPQALIGNAANNPTAIMPTFGVIGDCQKMGTCPIGAVSPTSDVTVPPVSSVSTQPCSSTQNAMVNIMNKNRQKSRINNSSGFLQIIFQFLQQLLQLLQLLRGGTTPPTPANPQPSQGIQPTTGTQPMLPCTPTSAPQQSTQPQPPATTIQTAFPNASNTGYTNAPGYPGSLTTYSPTPNGTSCSGTISSGMTYKFCNFVGGLSVGSSSNHVSNVTFYGCRFASNAIADANVAEYGDNITFDYSTFEPSAVSTPPTTYSKGYQYGIDQRYDGKLTINHSNFWGWANGIQFGYSNQLKPFTVSNSWFHDARDDGGIDHTDAILENYGGQSFVTITHNTIVSIGNTNGLALQGNNYKNITVTNNYFSGFGYTVNIGGSGAGSTNMMFTGNTFGTDIKPVFGPLYGWLGSSSANDTWRNNKWHVVSGGYDTNFSDDGKYWWPNGTLSTTDYTGL